MFDLFKWLCVLLLTAQWVLLPVYMGTVHAEIPLSGEKSHSPGGAARDQAQFDSDAEDEGVDYFHPEHKTLSDLFEVSEIPVSVDLDGQFIETMTRNRLLEHELADKVDVTGLARSIQKGRTFNRETLAAYERKKQAEAKTGQALGDLLPSVSVRANRGYEISEPSVVVDDATGELLPRSRHIRTDITFTVTQPLFDLSTFLEWQRRKELERARSESYRISVGDAYVSTVEAYLELVSSRLQTKVMSDFEARLAELLSYIEKRADAGAASVSDMSRVRARSQETASLRLEQESSHLAAGTEFARLTNVVPEKISLPSLEDVGYPLLPGNFEQAVKAAMKTNPEIATLTAELQSEKIDKLSSAGRFLPRFDAEYTDTYNKHAGGSDEDQRDRRTMLVMNWNLFRGGKDVNIAVERAARYRELQYRLDDQRRRVVQALAANYAALRTIGQRIVTGYEELESISTAAEAMSKRMLTGNQSLLDLLSVYDRHFRVRSRLIDLHVLEMRTTAQLVRLTFGSPWQPGEKSSLPRNGGKIFFPDEPDWLGG